MLNKVNSHILLMRIENLFLFPDLTLTKQANNFQSCRTIEKTTDKSGLISVIQALNTDQTSIY